MRLGPSLLGASPEFRRAYARRQPWDTPDRFYAENSREDVRDDAILAILVPSGAMLVRDVPNNSPGGRYTLRRECAAVFEPKLRERRWQALARAQSRSAGPGAGAVGSLPATVGVPLPCGGTRALGGGPGASLAARFFSDLPSAGMQSPVLLSLADAAPRLHPDDEAALAAAGVRIDPNKMMPDAILLERPAGGAPFLTFVEVVATGGWFTESRTATLRAKAGEAGFDPAGTRFVSAFASRADAVARKAFALQPDCVELWFADESHLGTMRFRTCG